MELKIPIEVDFDDLKSLLDDLGKLQKYKLFEGDEMVLVDIEDVAKVLMDHVKAKKSVQGDLISRKAVYDALECMRFASDAERRYGFSLLEQIPTAQSEIIRCKDCVLTDGHEPIADGRYWCMLHGAYMYYCSAAERRTDE